MLSSAMNYLRAHTTLVGVLVLLIALLCRFFTKMYWQRKMFRNLPGPPHSWLLGHIPVMARVAMKLPRRIHPHIYGHFIREEYGLGSVFYLDLWPLGGGTIIVQDPKVAQLITTQHSLLKHEALRWAMAPIVGNGDLVTLEGPQWKKWRSVFNPGFSTAHLMTLVPGIVDDVMVFCEVLGEKADRNEVFRLEDAATHLTVDIIGKVALGQSFNTQKEKNPLVEALRQSIRWLLVQSTPNPFVNYNPLRKYVMWRNGRIMDDYVNKFLEERFATRDRSAPKVKRTKTIIDLALDTYFADEEAMTGKSKDEISIKQTLPPAFRASAITQIKTFIFAGHDTTSSAICWAYHLLSKNPTALSQLRAEHDAILGPDVSHAPQLIRDNPHVLNKLDYTTAVVRETLRLYPPASSIRQGEPGFFIPDPTTGAPLPTDGMMVWSHVLGMHRHEGLWGPTVHAFDPSRFLPANAAALPKDAWRPFEKGPRNCIGQELAMLEAKVTLALTARSFDVRGAYDELEAVEADGSGWAKDKGAREGVQECWGDEAYQILLATAKPREGMPARVRRREV